MRNDLNLVPTALEQQHKEEKLSTNTTMCVGPPVQGVKGLLTALHVTLKRLLLGVYTDVDLEAVRGEEGLSAALLITHKCVFTPVGLLVCSQVSRRAVRPRAAFEHALVTLHLIEEH